ncbi:MAG: replicative DNA helicase [Myxococcota bacterium]|jgi:replicative DNA helicase
MAFTAEALAIANSGWAVLGACLVAGERLPICVAMGVEQRFFTLEDQRSMWLAMTEDDTVAADGFLDIMALRDALKARGIDAMKAHTLITSATETYSDVTGSLSDASFSMHMPHHVKSLRDRANARLVHNAVSMAEYQITAGASAHEVLAELREKIAPAENDAEKERSWAEVATDVLTSIETGEDAAGCVPVNLASIDKELGGGIGRGWFVVVLGRPASGKTAFVMHNILAPLAREGRRAFVASVEMSNAQLMKRLLMHETCVPTARMRPDHLRDGEWSRIVDAAQSVSRWPIVSADNLRSVSQICARARVEAKDGDLAAIFVDYIQIVDNGMDTPHLNIAHTVNELRALAKELQVPVIALSQSDLASRRAPGPLGNSSGKGAGEIEEVADLMIMLHRPDPDGDGTKAHVKTGKARHAQPMALNDTQVRFNERRLIYEEIAQ